MSRDVLSPLHPLEPELLQSFLYLVLILLFLQVDLKGLVFLVGVTHVFFLVICWLVLLCQKL